MSPYQVTKDFESALCEYTGARYAVAVNSATAALQMCCEFMFEASYGLLDKYNWSLPEGKVVEIPRRTYVSVPAAIKRAGGSVAWRDDDWQVRSGAYQLKPLPVWDSARRFTSGMYIQRQFQCVSFSTSKILGAEQGGAILHDCDFADDWFRRLRFDGRAEGVDPKDDHFYVVGMHCIMLPSTAAALILKLHHLPKHNADLPYYEYPDLSKHPAFA